MLDYVFLFTVRKDSQFSLFFFFTMVYVLNANYWREQKAFNQTFILREDLLIGMIYSN